MNKMVNKRKSYALVNAETGKIIKFKGVLQYFRLKQQARIEKGKLETYLRINILITKSEHGTKKISLQENNP